MQTTTVRLDTKMIDELDKIGKNIDRPRSWVIKEAIAQYLEYNKEYETAIEQGIYDVKSGRIVDHSTVINTLRAKGAKLD